MRKVIVAVLIVSMILTTGGFVTLADSVDVVVSTCQNENIEEETNNNFDDYTSKNGDFKNIDEATVSELEFKDIDSDELESNIDSNIEEPEEDIDLEDVATIELDEKEEDGTNIELDDIEINPEEQELKISTESELSEEEIERESEEESENEEDTTISTDSIIEKISYDDEDRMISTESEVEDINVVADSDILATSSVINSDDILSEDIASISEIEKVNIREIIVASDSQINIASLSEIQIASLSDIIINPMVASLSENFGSGTRKLPWQFYFGVYPQTDASGVQYEPIEWRLLSYDDNESLVYSYMILGGSTYGLADSKWSTGRTRAYLQNEFINKAFTSNQYQYLINEKTLTTRDESTNEKVFLMSIVDVGKLGGDKEAHSTEYAKKQGAVQGPQHARYTPDWWLREPTAFFSGILSGIIDTNSQMVDFIKGIRPMMYLNTAHPVFDSSHGISFDLDFASWKSESTSWRNFTSYYGGQKLPTTANLSLPEGVELAGWSKDGTYENLMSEIPLDCTEDLSLKAIFKSNIVYDLTDGTTGRSGSWDGNEGASFYYIGKTFTLPTNVKAPEATEEEMEEGFYKFFDHWEMDGKAVNAIPAGTKGVINLKAVYKSLPEYVWFGTYPQNDISGVELEPIRWRVIKQDGKEAILVSEKILDHRGFKNENVATTWEDSDIRTWLNDTFLNKAFTLNQINKNIVNKNLTTPTLSGNIETEDKVFSLSKDEYHGGGISFGIVDKQGRGTEYAKNVTWNGSTITMGIGRTSPWWLRSQQTTGIEANQADKVMQGAPSVDKANVNDGAGIRPFISVDLTEGKFKSSSNGVTWNLGPARFKDKSVLWNDYNAYQIGQKLPTEENLVIPDGLRFVGFRNTNNKEVITEIPADTIGDITLKLKFNGTITWNLVDEATGEVGRWDGEAGPEYFDTEEGIKTLPTNVTGSLYRDFDHWEMNGTKVTSIEPGDRGGIELKAVYKRAEYSITWSLTDGRTRNTGRWDGDAGPSSYEYGIGVKTLPTNVIGPLGKYFDHWEIGGIATTSITTKDFGNKVVKAIYKEYSHEYIWLGTYPQNDTSGEQLEPIKWRVIYKDSGEVFLLSEDIIDKKAHYSSVRAIENWGKSDIRSWLNDDFINNAFSLNQLSSIIEKNTVTANSKIKDKVYLLSKEELDYIYSNDRNAVTTEYAYINNSNNNTWWLRTEKDTQVYYYVDKDSIVRENSLNTELGIRPALYLDTSATSIYRKDDNHISFNLNGGSWKDESILWGEMDTYQGGQKLPTTANVNVPIGKELRGFIISGTTKIITEIPTNQTGDIELIAIYNAPYTITWDLKDGNTSNTGSWDGLAGPTSYYGGIGLSSLPTNVIGPAGREFDHWEINGNRVINISKTDSGNKTIKAVYKNKSYDIHWSLSGGSFETSYTAPASYEYGVGLNLLEATNKYVPPTGKRFNRWLLQFEGETTTTPATSISTTANKKVTVISECVNVSYNITYVDEGGSPITWNGTAGPTTYTYGTGVTYIPTNVQAPEHKEFDYWKINGVRVESIGPTETGDKTVVAVFKNKKYNITWKLNQTYTQYDPVIDDDIEITIYGDWKDEPGKDTYTYGEGYTFPATTSVIPTLGFMVDGWSIEDSTESMSTEISDVDFGDKVVQAIYRTETYNVTWNLNGAVLTLDADTSPLHPSEYTYGDVYVRPWELIDASDTNNYASIPAGKVPSHWVVNGVRSDSIPQGTRGDITITLIYTNTPSHNITWDYGTGENEWNFNGYVPPATYSEGVAVILPDKSFVSTADGKELDYFTVNGVRATEISSTSTDDVTVAAVLKKKSYRIKYNIGSGSWNGAEGAASYTYGTSYTLPTNIIGVRGQEFDHWEIGGVATTGISASDFGHKEFTAIYRNKTYNINWDTKNATITVPLPTSYTFGTETLLPVESEIAGYEGRIFAYWTVNGVIMTSIPSTYIGDVNIILNYATYTITWKLGEGQFNNYTPPAYYDGGVILKLPDSSKIIPPTDYEFDYFKVNNVKATEIAAGTVGDVVVEAVYKSKLDPETKYVVEISVKAKPNKTSYTVGDKFDPTGLVILVTYNDNTIADLKYDDTTKNDIIMMPDKDDVLAKYDAEVLVIYKNAATIFTIDIKEKSKPEPTPYHPGGGGGSSGGGGGGSGISYSQEIIKVTKVDQVKAIKLGVDKAITNWVYDPILNKFKMNIAVNEVSLPAVDGFYLINSIKEQNVNGMVTYVPETATYYFDKDGNMLTGWINTSDNKWYFLENVKTAREGMMVFGWYEIQGKWYYFTADGSMLENSVTPDGYFVGSDGAWIQQ